MKVIVRGRDLPISEKDASTMCKAIKYQKVSDSMKFLEKVLKKEMGVKNEGGRVRVTSHGAQYPQNVAKVFTKMLKSLSANASVKGMNTEKLVVFAKTDKASRPQRPGNRLKKFKRVHVTFEGFQGAEKEEKKAPETKKVEEKMEASK